MLGTASVVSRYLQIAGSYMSDFIREVDEEYRRERAMAFVRRYQIPLALMIVLIVVGAGVWRWYIDEQVGRAEAADARYEEAGAEARQGRLVEAQAGYKKLAADGPAGYALLSRLRAAEVTDAHNPDGAAKALDAVASDEELGAPALRDLARYRGALLRIDTEDPAAFDHEYARFALDSFTFHNGMRELLALAAMKRGDRPGAEKYLADILLDPLAPPALRNRAQAFRELVNSGPATRVSSAAAAPTVTPVATATSAPTSSLPAPTPLPPAPTSSPTAAQEKPEPSLPPAQAGSVPSTSTH